MREKVKFYLVVTFNHLTFVPEIRNQNYIIMQHQNYSAQELKRAREKEYTFCDTYYGYHFLKDSEETLDNDPTAYYPVEKIKLKNFTPKELTAVWYSKKDNRSEIDYEDSIRWDVLEGLTGCDSEYYQRHYNGSVEVAEIFDTEIDSYTFLDKEKTKEIFEMIDEIIENNEINQ